MKMLEGRERLLLEAPAGVGVREKFVIEAPNPTGLITNGDTREAKESVGIEAVGKERESVNEDTSKEMTISGRNDVSEPGEPVDVMAPKKDTRPAGVDGWQFKASSMHIRDGRAATDRHIDEKCLDVSSRRGRVAVPSEAYTYGRRY